MGLLRAIFEERLYLYTQKRQDRLIIESFEVINIVCQCFYILWLRPSERSGKKYEVFSVIRPIIINRLIELLFLAIQDSLPLISISTDRIRG